MKLQLLEYVGPETADDRSSALKRSSSQPPGPRPLSPPHLCERCVFVLMHILFRRVFLRGHVKFGFKLKIRTRSNRVMSRRGTGGLYRIYYTKNKQTNYLRVINKQTISSCADFSIFIHLRVVLKLKEQAVMKNEAT